MKKVLVVLFALGLVFAFSAPVMAVDVAVDGSYRVRGWYDNNSPLSANSTSSAYYDQRFRMGATFQIAKGLSVYTRFDALDHVWGDPAAVNTPQTNNVQFDMAYVKFVTPIGQFTIGDQPDGTWGTGFGNLEIYQEKVGLNMPLSPNWLLHFDFTKVEEADQGFARSDFDSDSYRLAIIYLSKDLVGGLLYVYGRDADPAYNLISGSDYLKSTSNVLTPYFVWKKGNLELEGEFGWLEGEINTSKLTAAQLAALNAGLGLPAGLKPAILGGQDVDLSGARYYLKAKYNMGASYVGGLWGYVQGDDPTTSMDLEGSINAGGDWDPMLILFNDNSPVAVGPAATATGTALANGSIYQVFAGTSMGKLSVMASLAMAEADETPCTAAGVRYVDDEYGTEFDIQAAYKLYDNLTYTVGFGYLWAGDYYKGANAAAQIDDTYLLMNTLEVVF